MSQDNPFLQAILASPDADAPRLIWADWLEEHGKPRRAELIRVQIELAKLPQEDSRCALLKRKEKALLKRYQSQWLKPFARFKGVSIGHFERGFPSAVTPLKRFERLADHAEAIAAAAPIDKLCYSDNIITDDAWSSFCSSSLLGRLKRIWVCRSYLGAGNVRVLADSGRLERLSRLELKQSYPEDAGVAALANCAQLAGLAELDLSSNNLGPASLEALVGSPYLSNLTALDLGSNSRLGGDNVLALPSISALSSLATLKLNYCEVGPQGGRALAGISGLVRLSCLDLTGNAIGDEGVAALAGSPLLGRLTMLNLTHNELGAAGVRALASSPDASRLMWLGLGANQIDAAGMQALVESPYLNRLTWLDLRNNPGLEAAAAALQQRFGQAAFLAWPSR